MCVSGVCLCGIEMELLMRFMQQELVGALDPLGHFFFSVVAGVMHFVSQPKTCCLAFFECFSKINLHKQ